MRLTILILALCLSISGCATPEQRARATAQAFYAQTAQDNATCKNYGLEFGTAAYAECRQHIEDRRSADAQAAAQAGSNALAALAIAANRPVITPAVVPQTQMTCQRNGQTTYCSTY